VWHSVRLFFPAAFFIVAFFGGFSAASAAPVDDAVVGARVVAAERDYRLGIGDVVRIEVHDEPDLTIETQLPTTGIIDYPFLGKLQVVGQTVAQLQERIASGLKAGYLVSPEVLVRVIQYRPFFVRGQVRSSGGYPYVPGLTVEKAVTIAGGFTDRASLKNIFLIRENARQDQKVKVDLDSSVSPGDTIIVEESLF
jgi:polysaccharide biosynthesis/export protein VpsN